MSRARYDENFRQQAIALAVEIGPADAARQLGVKAATLRSWCSRADVATDAARETTKAATEALKATAEERRALLATKLLTIAELAAEQELAMIADASLRDVVGARTRAIHDHQLLTGAATSRTEHAGKDAAHTIADELAARRKAKAA